MLTLTIDGRAVALSAEDVAFLGSCMSAALSHRGHRFERTHHGSAGVLRVSVGETVRELPSTVQAFKRGTPAAVVQTDC